MHLRTPESHQRTMHGPPLNLFGGAFPGSTVKAEAQWLATWLKSKINSGHPSAVRVHILQFSFVAISSCFLWSF